MVTEKKDGDRMKRFCACFVLIAILMGTLFSGNVFAVEEKGTVELSFPEYEKNSGPSFEALDAYVDIDALRERLMLGFKECSERIPLYDFRIPGRLSEELNFYIWKEMPEAFHVYGLGSSTDYGFVDDLYVSYLQNPSDYENSLKACREVAQKLIEGVDDPALSDAQKALILHDRLAAHNEYDYTYNAPFTGEIVGALVNRTSVCEGYAMAYSYLLDLVGIRNYYCMSEVINHGWNIVYIDGVKYHVDVTWDDIGYLGWIYHDNFLRSSAGMIANGHCDNGVDDFDDSPDSTVYDNAFWRNINTEFQLLDSKIYYIEESYQGTKLKELSGEAHKEIADISDAWETGIGYWGDGYQVLASDGQDLLYSGGDKIYRYCTESGQIEPIWEPSLPAGTAIFNFRLQDGVLKCFYNDYPNSDEVTEQTNWITKAYQAHSHAHEHIYTDACDADCNLCSAPRKAPHVYDGQEDLICNLCSHEREPYLAGDVDSDEQVDLDDAIYLLYYVNFPSTYAVNQSVDFDGSGKVGLNDAIYLLYHVNFPASYPLQ